MRRYLKRLAPDLDLRRVETASEALAVLADWNPELVLLDLRLPGMSGVDALERIKANADWRGIPVVVLTSSTDERDIRACYERGASAYVPKPFGDEAEQRYGALAEFWLKAVAV